MQKNKLNSSLYKGKVYHKRFTPREHEFLYSSYFIKISLKELPQTNNIFFSVNRLNLFSFYFKDHGYRDGSSLWTFAVEKLKANGQSAEFDDIIIHTLPRVLGHVFNPVSFWYILKDGRVTSIIAEVNSTFGETHSYILDPKNPAGEKLMQVSPFNRIEGHYSFKFQSNSTRDKVDIEYSVKDKKILFASIYGSSVEWTSFNFLKLFFFNPFHNFLVLAYIHFEAIRLFLKKIPFYGKNGVVHD